MKHFILSSRTSGALWVFYVNETNYTSLSPCKHLSRSGAPAGRSPNSACLLGTRVGLGFSWTAGNLELVFSVRGENESLIWELAGLQESPRGEKSHPP